MRTASQRSQRASRREGDGQHDLGGQGRSPTLLLELETPTLLTAWARLSKAEWVGSTVQVPAGMIVGVAEVVLMVDCSLVG